MEATLIYVLFFFFPLWLTLKCSSEDMCPKRMALHRKIKVFLGNRAN